MKRNLLCFALWRSTLIIAVTLFFPFISRAQECNCAATFDWVVNTFEKNDAGFQYVIDKKGLDDYKKYTATTKEQAKNITKITDCQLAIYNWLKYFRPGHIGIGLKGYQFYNNNNKLNADSVRALYKNSRAINFNRGQLTAALKKKKDNNPIEGVWTDGRYVIGIIGDSKNELKYSGIIIKADSVYWMPKQVKVDLMLNADKKTFAADYYMQNHSKQVTQAYIVDGTNNLMVLYNAYWTRVDPEKQSTPKEKILLGFAGSRTPFIEKLSEKTLYLRIPSFMANQKHIIDSSLLKYDSLIKSTPNLIIDIRNGTGGSDASYAKIMPYLYTTPVRSVSVQLLATELNATAYERYAKQYDDTANANYCLRAAKKMREYLGTFITTSDEIASTDTFKTIMPYPQKVAIICNHNNGSTDEQFLLEAKESGKVKVFGRSTFGELDISNMNSVDSPDGKFQLNYCMSKSYRIPNFTIDGVGIQPDYFIDDAIKESDWIEYTQSVLEY